MPTKTFSGSLINYGTTLPLDVSAPDGALFFKTTDDGAGGKGLYLFSFVQDFSAGSPGDQAAQAWVALTGSSAPTVTGSVTFNGGGSGGAPGTTYNGGGSVTVSYNTIGAPSATGAGASGTWGINISGNAGTATRLATARTFTLTGAVTGTATFDFDGTANIEIPTTISGGITGDYVPLSGGTMTGALKTTALAVGGIAMPSTGSANFSGSVAALQGFVADLGSIKSGEFVAARTYIAAGDTQGGTTSLGTVRLQGSIDSEPGSIEFYAGLSGTRTGLIRSLATNVSGGTGADNGSITHVAGSHDFLGNVTTSGNIIADGNVTAYSGLYSTSDGRLKRDIATIEGALGKVKALRGVTYTLKDSGRQETGLIAQEVLQVVPEVVREGSDGTYSVSYGNLVGLLVEAVKEQQATIERQQALIDDLLRRMA